MLFEQAHADSPLPHIRGLAFLGFPLHPSKQPSRERGEHLAKVQVPMLFMQGTRDTLADLQEFLKSSGIDAVGSTQRALREYVEAGGRRGSGTLLALLLDLPKAREPGGPPQAIDTRPQPEPVLEHHLLRP